MYKNLVMLILVMVLNITLAGCSNYELNGTSFDIKHKKMVETKAGIKLPEGSKGLNLYYKRAPMDPYLMAKIEIPESALNSFLQSMKDYPVDKNGQIDTTYMKKVKWWNPQTNTIQNQWIYGHDKSIIQIQLCKEDNRNILYVLACVM